MYFDLILRNIENTTCRPKIAVKNINIKKMAVLSLKVFILIKAYDWSYILIMYVNKVSTRMILLRKLSTILCSVSVLKIL